MRIVFGISMVAAAAGMVPATAAANPVDLFGIKSQPAPGRITPVESKIGPDFRVRADLATSSAGINPLGDPEGPMRRRFASSMIDYYPLGGSGLRLSGGMRFFSVSNFLKDAEKATGGLLYNPRLTGSGSSVRAGFSRHTPAATVGYTASLHNAVFGFEVGSLIGNVNSNLPRSLERLSNRGRGGMNPIANLVVGMRF